LQRPPVIQAVEGESHFLLRSEVSRHLQADPGFRNIDAAHAEVGTEVEVAFAANNPDRALRWAPGVKTALSCDRSLCCHENLPGSVAHRRGRGKLQSIPKNLLLSAALASYNRRGSGGRLRGAPRSRLPGVPSPKEVSCQRGAKPTCSC